MSTAPDSAQQPEPQPPERQQPEPQVRATRDEVRVRRAPKYPVFIFGGILLGVVVTFIAVLVAPGDDPTPFAQVFGYFVLFGIAIGALVGAVIAVVIDAVLTRRGRSAEVERTVVETPEPEAEPSADDEVEGELE